MDLGDRIGLRIKLHDLRVLLAVVQAGTMGKAATLLNTTQSAISRSIAELERAVGVRLLHRSPQGVTPTECGRALCDGGMAVFDGLRLAAKKIEFLADPMAGEVRIGSSALLAASFVSAVVDRLSRRYPRMSFRLVTAHVERLHLELSARNVDFLIVRRFGPILSDELDFEPLFEDSFVIVAGANNPLVRRRKIELADLVSEPWVLPASGSVIASVVAEAVRARGLDYPRATVVTESSEVRTSLLATGRFISVFPNSALRFPVRRADIVRLGVELPMASLPNGIATLKNRELSPVAQLVIGCARDFSRSSGKGNA